MNSDTTLKKRIVLGTVAQVVSQIFVTVLGIVTLKLITNYLGIKDYGVYATVLSFVSTFALLTDLGLNAINGREIAKYPDRAGDIIGHNLGLRIVFSLIMIPVIFGLSYVFYPHASHLLRYGILLLTGFLLFDAARATAIGYFTAHVRNDIVAIINGAQQLIVAILIIIVIKADLGFYGLIISFIVANITGTLATLLLVGKNISIRPKFNMARWRSIIGLSASLGMIQLINMMYLKADSIMLSILKGTTSVGIYGIAYSMIMAFLTLPSFIMTALIPSMATANNETVTLIVQKAYNNMVLLAALLGIGSFVVRHEIILIVTNSNFSAATTPFAILGIASVFSYISSVFGYASVSLNKHHKIVYVSAGMLLLNILINFILIPLYSYNGAAVATLISEALSTIIIMVLFAKETSITLEYFKPAIKPIACASLTLLIVLGTRAIYAPSNVFLNLILFSIEIFVLYGVLLKISGALPEEINDFTIRKKVI